MIFRIEYMYEGEVQRFAHYKTGDQPEGWEFTTYETLDDVRDVYDNNSAITERFGSPTYSSLDGVDIIGNPLN